MPFVRKASLRRQWLGPRQRGKPQHSTQAPNLGHKSDPLGSSVQGDAVHTSRPMDELDLPSDLWSEFDLEEDTPEVPPQTKGSYRATLRAFTQTYNSQRKLELSLRQMEYNLKGYYIALLCLRQRVRSRSWIPEYHKWYETVMGGFTSGKAHARITSTILRYSAYSPKVNDRSHHK
jgi:hypothetical protein